MLDVIGVLKSYATPFNVQPAKLYPLLVGVVGCVALFPSITLWVPTELPPFDLNVTV